MSKQPGQHDTPLDGMLVVEVSSGIGGSYATKMLADGGAEVVKIELAGGDPLRARSITGATIEPGGNGALFGFLAASKRSVVVDPESSHDRQMLEGLLAVADAVVWSEHSVVAEATGLTPAEIRRLAPKAVVVAISAFGLDGPWSGRPATSATIEAWTGGPAQRGRADRTPVLMGGEPSEWVAGMFGALGALVGLFRRTEASSGELIDISMLEALTLTQVMYPRTYMAIAGKPWWNGRQPTVPEIHPTKDGFVGFMVVTGQQWLDFCALVEQPEWADREELFNMARRGQLRDELVVAINQWTMQRTTDEAAELASLMRVPATPVASGASAPTLEHFTAGGFFTKSPSGDFIQPDVPYRLSGGARTREFEAAPRCGEHTELYRRRHAEGVLRASGSAAPVPAGTDAFAELRIADFAQFWAGGLITHSLSMFGADVIHVESVNHPDGARTSNVRPPGQPLWWEYGPFFQAMATNKRAVTLDMENERGRDLARTLIGHCDVVVENYTPRVFENWGMDYEALSAARPDLIVVRAPAWGLTGPWRDRGGYAPIMEQASGLGYITGYPDDNPISPFGPADPIAGTHATIALLLALHYRRRTGRGMLLEVPMAGSALNLAAEGVVEYSAYGNLVERRGNRSAFCAPQGMYLTADPLPDGRQDRWVLISVATDDQWRALAAAIGEPELAHDPALVDGAGRAAAHDRLDTILATWCAGRTRAEIIDTLWGVGVPTAEVKLGHEHDEVEQLQARGYFQFVDHPLHGSLEQVGYPFRSSAGPVRMHRRHAPLLGEHNVAVLHSMLGLSQDELDELESAGIIGSAAAQPEQSWSV